MSTLRLTNLTFQAGANPGAPSLSMKLGAVTVIVGPNNAGKSATLREIEAWCKGEDGMGLVLASLDADLPATFAMATQFVERFRTTTRPGEIGPRYIMVAVPDFSDQQNPTTRFALNLGALESEYTYGSPSTAERRRNMLRLYTVRLDGRSRFSLVERKATGNRHENQRAENYFQALADDEEARIRVRHITEQAIGLHFSLDPLDGGYFSIDMNEMPPPEDAELNLGPSGKQYHNAGNPIATLGDGVKCFVGLVAATRSLPHKIMLVDEPEAFLHPPLARTLGRELTFAAQDNEASLVVATHSSEFLIGCVEASLETAVVRLTYEGGKATARHLQSETVREMFTNPLLRSTDVLDALFHRAAVITEADTDRVFYGEMNRRLQEDNRGIPEALFLNATGKGTIHQIIAPLRRIGIPAAAIVDLDLLEQSSHGTWGQLLEACQIPQAVRVSLEGQRKQVAAAFKSLTRADVATAAFVVKANRYDDLSGDQKQRAEELLAELATLGKMRHSGSRAIKTQGIRALAPPDKVVAEALLTELRKYGLFLVSVGEVERWLGDLGVGGHGANWLTAILKQIGNTSTDTNYLRAGTNDVWQFLEQIAQWTSNPDREGTRLT